MNAITRASLRAITNPNRSRNPSGNAVIQNNAVFERRISMNWARIRARVRTHHDRPPSINSR